MSRWNYSLLFMVLLFFYLTGSKAEYEPSISTQSPMTVPEYIVGIHPLHNPQRLLIVYGPIVDYMNQHIQNARFKLEASRDYAEFEKKLYAGHFAFAMPNPYQTVLSLKYNYHIFGKMADDAVFSGIILVRKDSPIKNISDLKGKAISYPAATALAATMMPQYYLHTNGINVNKDIENRYVGSQESSIMNVLRGHVAAGATWPVPWKQFSTEHPDLASQLVIKWQTEPLLNNAWVVHDTVPQNIAEQFATLLFSLNNDEIGKQLLQQIPISHFEPANDATYRPVQAFLKKFSETVRPIEY